MNALNKRQEGFSLFMVMIIMLVIALLVVVSSQSSSTEMRISTNEADRKYALSLAENGLRDAEDKIRQFSAATTNITFSYNCVNGYCAPVEEVHMESTKSLFKINDGAKSTLGNTVAWKREIRNVSVFDMPNNSIAGNNSGVRYIIEFLGERTEPSTNTMGRYFRVTVRAKGQNENTHVMLQSYVELNSAD